MTLLLGGCGGPGSDPGPGYNAPERQAPGLYQGTAPVPATYPGYSEPANSANSQGTPSGQNRLAVSGPEDADGGVWTFQAEGTIESRPLRSPEGELYILAGTQMLVCDLSGSELRRFSAAAASYGNERLRWIAGQGPAYIAGDRKLHCYSPTGEALWSFGQGRIGDEWDLGGRLLVEDVLDDAGTRLVSLNSDGTEQWAITCGNGLQSIQECPDGGLLLMGWGDEGLQRLNEDGSLRWSAAALLGPRRMTQLANGNIELDEQAELLGGPHDTLGWVTIRETFSASGELLGRVLLHDDNLYGPTGDSAQTLDGVLVTGLPTNKPLLSDLPEYLDSFNQPSLDYSWDDYTLSVDQSGGFVSLLKAGQRRWSISSATQDLGVPVFGPDGLGWMYSGPLGLLADMQQQQITRQDMPSLVQPFFRSSAVGPDGSRYLLSGSGVVRLNAAGALLAQWYTPAPFDNPVQLFCGSDGTVYCACLMSFGSYDPVAAVFALSPALEEYWHYVDEYDIRQRIALARDGSVLLFSEDYREEYRAPVAVRSEIRSVDYRVDDEPFGWQSGSLKCLNRDGSLRWSIPLGGPPAGSPLCGDADRVYWVDGGSSGNYGGLEDGTAIGQRMLRCVSLDGSLQWQQPLDTACQDIRAQLAGGELVLQLTDQAADRRYPPLWLAAYNSGNGAELWRFRRDEYGLLSCVADDAGRMYIAAQEYDKDDPVLILDSSGNLLNTIELEGATEYGSNITLSPAGDICLTNGLQLWVIYR